MTRRFDLIAFDWDGTLFDSTAHIVRAIQSACVEVGAPAPSDADAAYVIGLGLKDALMHCAPSVSEDQYPALGQAYRRHYVRHQQDLTLFEGVMPMLQDLKQRQWLLAVATGKSRAGLNEVLRQSELHQVFDSTRTADETASKPHPLMLQELMAELGVDPQRVLMIGDTTHDLEMAARAGVASVAVSYGAHGPDLFEAHAPLFVAHSTKELHAWLTSN